nr:tigger transposable element-derived protein 6-like [Rhipicephalus microplus]
MCNGNGKRKHKNITIKQESNVESRCVRGQEEKSDRRLHIASLSTLSTILSKRETITGATARGIKGNRMKLRVPTFKAIKKAVFNWLFQIGASSIPVSRALLQQKARNITWIMGYNDFVASDGRLQRFKECHDFVGRAVNGESLCVDHEAAVAWIEKNTGQLLGKYSTKDLFNADETALFYKMLQQKTLTLKVYLCQSGKRSNVSVTGLLCVKRCRPS